MFNDYVTQLYRNFLGREPDEAGLSYWTSQLQSGSIDAISITKAFATSAEHVVFFKQISLLYFAAFNRLPDAEGLEYWANDFRKSGSFSAIAASIAASEEFRALHNESTDTQFLTDLYRAALQREPDNAGLLYWKQFLDLGVQRSLVMAVFSISPESNASRSEEIEYALLYRGIFGELPTQEMIDAAVPIKDINALIETLYESSGYTGAKVPGLDMYVAPEPEPEPQPEPEPEPEPDSGPPPDTTPPIILLFTVSSLTQLEVMSSETGSAGLYNETGDALIPSTTISLPSANMRTDLTVSAQATLTTARLQVFDSSGNSTFSPTLVKLGTIGNDSITASAAGDYIFGFGGNNTLIGGIGHDIIAGGGDDDTILGGDGDDSIAGGGGNDTLTGGSGNDTFFMTSGTSKITDLGGSDVFIISSGASLSAATISSNYLATDASENLSGSYNARFDMASSATVANFSAMTVRSEQYGGVRINAHASTASTITGSSGSDVLIGSSAADSLDGGAGSDDIMGGVGNDTITGGAGADVLTGELGDDVFVYSSLEELFAANALFDSITGGDGTDTISMNFTDAYTIAVEKSWARANTVEVLAQNVANSNNITITLNADAFTAGIYIVTLSGDTNASGTNTINASSAGAGQNLNLIGSVGNDSLIGGGGDDVINGGAGNDTITGGAGADVLTGGSGNNTSSYVGSAAVTVNLLTGVNTGGDAQGDALTNIQNLIGSSNGDNLTGDANNNIITGGAGADVLTGGGGIDTFVFATGDGVSLTGVSTSTIGVGTTITVSSDVITDFGSTDILTTDGKSNLSSLMGINPADGDLGDKSTYIAYGNYAAGIFTVAEAFDLNNANDALLITDGANVNLNSNTNIVILDNLTAALVGTTGGNFINVYSWM